MLQSLINPADAAATTKDIVASAGLFRAGIAAFLFALLDVPLAIASFITGIVRSLGTKSGLFRHWWLLISLVLTVVALLVLLSEADPISGVAELAADPTVSDSRLPAVPGTLPHSVGGLVVLLAVQVLNVYKPQGLTPFGWRKQHAERRSLP